MHKGGAHKKDRQGDTKLRVGPHMIQLIAPSLPQEDLSESARRSKNDKVPTSRFCYCANRT
jgi:hypothetical protein